MHGSYGFCWLLKYFTFRGAKWEQECALGGGILLFFLLSTYWVAPYLLASNVAGSELSNGFFRYVRHPNYLGEMMIYGSFALLSQHWLPWLILAYWWIALFYVNMRMIEKSLSRYPEWESYQARTGMLLPRLLSWFESRP